MSARLQGTSISQRDFFKRVFTIERQTTLSRDTQCETRHKLPKQVLKLGFQYLSSRDNLSRRNKMLTEGPIQRVAQYKFKTATKTAQGDIQQDTATKRQSISRRHSSTDLLSLKSKCFSAFIGFVWLFMCFSFQVQFRSFKAFALRFSPSYFVSSFNPLEARCI